MWTIKSFSMAFLATLNITDSPESFLECRICHNGHEDGAVESYCFCRGSNGFLHQKCLLHWLAVSGRNACEICLRPYEIQQGRLHWCWKVRNCIVVPPEIALVL